MSSSSKSVRAFVCLVDDDESVREALPDLLGELGFEASTFASAHDFLASGEISRAECLILDVAMPGMSGPELQLELHHRGLVTPIVFITAQRNDALFTQVIRRGATACLLKPFSDSALFDAVHAALASGRQKQDPGGTTAP